MISIRCSSSSDLHRALELLAPGIDLVIDDGARDAVLLGESESRRVRPVRQDEGDFGRKEGLLARSIKACMLEPRPEIKIAVRLRRDVTARAAADSVTRVAVVGRNDPAESDGVSPARAEAHDGIGRFRARDQNHADAAIERAQHFRRADPARAASQANTGGNRDRGEIELRRERPAAARAEDCRESRPR